MVQVPNHKDYRYKHPRGEHEVQNCIVIDDCYTMFDPYYSFEACSISRSKIVEALISEFNLPRGKRDIDRIEEISTCVALGEGSSNSLYVDGDLVTYEAFLEKEKSKKIEEWQALCLKDMPSENSWCFSFDFNKFNLWLQDMELHLSPSRGQQVANDQQCSTNVPDEMVMTKKEINDLFAQVNNKPDLKEANTSLRQTLSKKRTVHLFDYDPTLLASRMFLGKLAEWYISSEDRLITSDEEIDLSDSRYYNFGFDRKCHFPPLPNYTSPKYWQMPQLGVPQRKSLLQGVFFQPVAPAVSDGSNSLVDHLHNPVMDLSSR